MLEVYTSCTLNLHKNAIQDTYVEPFHTPVGGLGYTDLDQFIVLVLMPWCVKPAYLVLPGSLSLSPWPVLLLCEAELFVSLYKGVGVRLVTMLSIPCGRRQMAVSPLGVGLHQFLRHLQGPRAGRH